MVRGIYESVLSLYPARYREMFGAEMMATHARAAGDSRKRGILSFVAFSMREMAGLISGALSEWISKWIAPQTYITSRCQPRSATDLPPQIAEVQNRLENLLQSMEFAIAHHDFPKARFYSNEERVTRALLERLMTENKVSEPPALPKRAPA